MRVKVSLEAAEELMEAAAWYEIESPGLGEQLIDIFEQAATKLSAPNPPPIIRESRGTGIIGLAHDGTHRADDAFTPLV